MAQAARSLPPAGGAHRPRSLTLVPPPRRHPVTRQVLWRRRLVALLALPAVVAAGAAWLELSRPAPGPAGAGAIASMLRQGERDPATLCAHLSPAMLSAAGGRAACVASSPRRGPGGAIHDIRISGASATAVVSRPGADELVRLVRRGGTWKVDDVH